MQKPILSKGYNISLRKVSGKSQERFNSIDKVAKTNEKSRGYLLSGFYERDIEIG
jgi:hypothetical protein